VTKADHQRMFVDCFRDFAGFQIFNF